MKAYFTTIARGITHTDLNAELTLLMSPDQTLKLWEKIFVAHENEILINPNKQGCTYLDDHLESQHELRAQLGKNKLSSPFEENSYVCTHLTR